MYDDSHNIGNPVDANDNQDESSSASNESPVPAPMEVVTDEEIEEVSDSIFDGFQIVRSEYFSQLREPSISFSQGKIGVNSACIKKLPKVDYAQILVNQEKKMLAIRPCKESEIFSFQWCTYRVKDGKRLPRQVTGRMFFLKICALMKWNMDYRYKILGKLIRANDEYLFIFNLRDAQTFIREQGAEDDKPRMSRTAIFPEEWQNKFGIPYEEHQKALQINMFQGFAIYSIKGDTAAAPVQTRKPSDQEQQNPKDAHPGGE